MENGPLVAAEKQIEIDAKRRITLFLADTEKKAFRIAVLSVNNDADALDIVQEAMMKLVSNYLLKDEKEWKPLFYRILHNRIMDWHRKEKLRRTFFFWQHSDTEEDQYNDSLNEGIEIESPDLTLEKTQQQEKIIRVLKTLPVKQQQCFLLRSWEGLSVKETAEIMACSEGTIKTHYYRACQKLHEILR